MNIRNYKIISGILLLIIIFVVSYFQLSGFKNSNKQPVEFVISKGMGMRNIANELTAKKIIRSPLIFEIYGIISRKAGKFKPGTYEFNFNQTIPEIIQEISSGPKEISATIIPGMTLKEIDDYLSSAKIIKKNSLINFDTASLKSQYPFLERAGSLEGYLLPDTYQFFAGAETDVAVKKILDNFQKKTTDGASSHGGLTELPRLINNKNSSWLIIASILEREVIDIKEKRIVAGIIRKRLKAKMPLQIDATVIYAKCDGRYDCPIGPKDFKLDSSYNTYQKIGLPPAPISNPGIESMIAASDSITTEYWFYLSDPRTKKTIFSKSLEEHNLQRKKYLGI